jgi:hypothetical protein
MEAFPNSLGSMVVKRQSYFNQGASTGHVIASRQVTYKIIIIKKKITEHGEFVNNWLTHFGRREYNPYKLLLVTEGHWLHHPMNGEVDFKDV